MSDAVHALTWEGFALGAQAQAFSELAARATPGQRRLATWTTEYGPLNRLVSLWDAPSGATAATASLAPDWLDPGQSHAVLTPQRALRTDLLQAPLLELRMYAAHEGRCGDFLQALLAALPHRERYSPCAGVWKAHERGRDVVVHLWAYENLEARMAARTAAMGDASWSIYRATIRPMLARMQAFLLVPVVAQGHA